MQLFSFLTSISLFICTTTYCPNPIPDANLEEEYELQPSIPVIGDGVPIRFRSTPLTQVFYRTHRRNDPRRSLSAPPPYYSSDEEPSDSSDEFSNYSEFISPYNSDDPDRLETTDTSYSEEYSDSSHDEEQSSSDEEAPSRIYRTEETEIDR